MIHIFLGFRMGLPNWILLAAWGTEQILAVFFSKLIKFPKVWILLSMKSSKLTKFPKGWILLSMKSSKFLDDVCTIEPGYKVWLELQLGVREAVKLGIGRRAHFLANGTKGELRTFLAKCDLSVTLTHVTFPHISGKFAQCRFRTSTCDFSTFQTKLVGIYKLEIDQLNI